MATDYCKLVPCPPASAINSGLTSCPTKMLVERFGMPREVLTDDCRPVTNRYWKARMRTENLGPFRATGFTLALALFREAFAAVKAEKPDLYKLLGSAGMLCCRRVRGSKSLSNHGLGLALDITIGGKLDARGDGKVQVGLLELYSILKRFGIYWGAEFNIEDSMHFEVSAQVVERWISEGLM